MRTGRRSPRQRQKSNLFAVDVESIPRLLADANPGLQERCDELLAAFDRMPAHLVPEDEERARRFHGQIRSAIRSVNATRRADKRAFLDGGRAVDGFFGDLVRPLERALGEVERRLNALVRGRRAPKSLPAVVTGPGGVGVVGATPTSPEDFGQTVWTVERIDRATLDLESLRDVFTDRELEAAVERHLRANGPDALDGVTYSPRVRR